MPPGPTSPETPVFQSVIGSGWSGLGPVIRRHYRLRPFSDDYVLVRGVMGEVHHGFVAKLLMPMARLFGALVPYRGRDVPIEVHYRARPDSAGIHWDRVFHFPGRPPFHFRSSMAPVRDNEVIEFVRFGVGMRLLVTAEDGAIVFRDRGYVWRLFGRDWPLPLGLLMGKAYVEERPANEAEFTMRMRLRHPLLGELFRYEGRFTIDEEASRAPALAMDRA
ncbi:MAG: DUF4166 domain-containing protein [Methylobacterium mesophilicum]|nr:DUF4166 domain-containing protein [Methylobacterium mesophilicum]